ncbi:SDR family oxidoreductase [Galbitalea soli]|uniref:SDR family oxidoreductase n=1 Tax=Galbitalea soli TaxID=1268042 RepID=A0A7C9TQS6_9MICO|nr:SDR family oxidoreductase [Galbitalea soli]NEM91677.1 SDR family oxidoreductase [Galbitalea soli]NYJ30373.1 NAD(P)H dehydrogenase (quinone) [Galbitalea soli]
MTIVVTGATGHLGRLIIEALLRDGVTPSTIVAGGRSLDKIDDLVARGVTAARIDYADPASLDAALAGADTVVLVSGSEVGQRVAQHAAVIDAAVRAGVGHLIYTSAPKATTSPLVLAPEHKATEEAIAAAGIPATILRNGWYTENYTGQAEQLRATGRLVASVGDGRVASASRVDYADAAAAVAIGGAPHIGAVYELSGDVAWDFTQLAAAFTEVLGREVVYVPVSTEEHLAILTGAGLDEGTAGFVVALDGNTRDGLLAETSGDLARLIGRPTTPLVDGIRAAL